MQNPNFINANPAIIMQRLYQIKADQDGEDVTVIVHAKKRADLPTREADCPPAMRMEILVHGLTRSQLRLMMK